MENSLLSSYFRSNGAKTWDTFFGTVATTMFFRFFFFFFSVFQFSDSVTIYVLDDDDEDNV